MSTKTEKMLQVANETAQSGAVFGALGGVMHVVAAAVPHPYISPHSMFRVLSPVQGVYYWTGIGAMYGFTLGTMTCLHPPQNKYAMNRTQALSVGITIALGEKIIRRSPWQVCLAQSLMAGGLYLCIGAAQNKYEDSFA